MLLVGIDEAGYGPLLGPLVVSAVGVRLPDEVAGISLWELLSGGVCDRTAGAKGRLVVADSKKLYHGHERDLKELERSALGAVMLGTGAIPGRFDELMGKISLEPDPHLGQRWYCHQPLMLPCRAQADGLRLAVNVLSRELASVGAAAAMVKSVPLVERKYNHLVRQIKNKSEILFSQTARLIHEAIESSQEPNVRICVDKQGGKGTYVRNLLRVFPSAQLSVVREGEDDSEYLLRHGERTIRISFSKKGEQKHLLIAWASIVSKYVRELFMMQFNSFWRAADPNLVPTAGYWEDGQRFLKDIEPLLGRMNIAPADLIRQL